jgi:hypothetical protein
MQPRLILRTHYQVDEPAILRTLIARCTNPTRTDYPEVIAERLAVALRGGGWDFNAAAGRYAVDLARGAGLLTDNMGWTSRAHLLNLFADRSAVANRELSPHEGQVVFAVFFETDGAAMVTLSQWLERDGRIPGANHTWNELANDLVIAVYGQSMPLIQDVRDRTAVRHVLDRRKGQPFSGRSGEHQGYVHAQTMHRMGMCEESDGRARVYTVAKSASGTPTRRFLDAVPTLRDLEDAIRERRWSAVAGQVLSPPDRGSPAPGFAGDAAAIIAEMTSDYHQICGTGVSLCPIEALIEAVQVRQLVKHGQAIGYQSLLDVLVGWQRANARTVRFHVDRFGRPAYLKIT